MSLQSGEELVFLKTAKDRAAYRGIMLATTGLLLGVGVGLTNMILGKGKIA